MAKNAANNCWHLLKEGEKYGPYLLQQLMDMVREGHILGQDLLWNPDYKNWVRADRVPELVSFFGKQNDEKKLKPKDSLAKRTAGHIDSGKQPDQESSDRKMRKGCCCVAVAVLLIVLIIAAIFGFNALTDGFLGIRQTTLEAATFRQAAPDFQPMENTDTFTPDDEEIFVIVSVENARSGSQLTARWLHAGEVLLASYQKELSGGDQKHQFSIVQPPFGWYEGNYEVIISLDGKQIVTLPFTVSD